MNRGEEIINAAAGASPQIIHRDSHCAERHEWLSRDGVWRCSHCAPPYWPGEIIDQRSGQLSWPDTSALSNEQAILLDAQMLVDSGLASWEDIP